MIKIRTTIQISDDLRKRLKVLASLRDIPYEDILKDMADLFKASIPFISEEEFATWFEKNLDKFGFSKIIEKRKDGFPKYKLEDNKGNTKEVEVELVGVDFERHGHNPANVDLIICMFSSKSNIHGVPVISIIDTTNDQNELLNKYSSNYMNLNIPVVLANKIEEKIKGTSFNSVSNYVVYLLRQVLSNIGDEDITDSIEKDEKKVKDRLRILGYLD